ncbi:MAG: hypothetical protein U0805_10435 [Pirellulales bacterium]
MGITLRGALTAWRAGGAGLEFQEGGFADGRFNGWFVARRLLISLIQRFTGDDEEALAS